MSSPITNKQEKPKEFNVSNVDISEHSFLSMMLRAKQEEYGYFSERLRLLEEDVEKRLGIAPTSDVNWNNLYTTGKIFASKSQKQPEAQTEMKDNVPH
jgi:hypothetical protein